MLLESMEVSNGAFQARSLPASGKSLPNAFVALPLFWASSYRLTALQRTPWQHVIIKATQLTFSFRFFSRHNCITGTLTGHFLTNLKDLWPFCQLLKHCMGSVNQSEIEVTSRPWQQTIKTNTRGHCKRLFPFTRVEDKLQIRFPNFHSPCLRGDNRTCKSSWFIECDPFKLSSPVAISRILMIWEFHKQNIVNRCGSS